MPRTLARRLGSSVGPLPAGAAQQALRERLLAGGLYADEPRFRELLAAGVHDRIARADALGGAPALPLRRAEGERVSTPRRALVIGGFGFIGVNLTERLVAHGHGTTVRDAVTRRMRRARAIEVAASASSKAICVTARR